MYLNLFKKTQLLPIDIETCWKFFSDPKNLSLITPPEMNFQILTDLPDEIYPGLIIQYKVSPILSLRMNWVTEITQARKPYYFIDEQRFGPYKFWHHQHHFKEHQDGIEMTDIVHYRIPFGFAGKMFGKILVESQLNKIFDFREKKLKELF
jgi:ligand-binding SRPBCC domain-containing protein